MAIEVDAEGRSTVLVMETQTMSSAVEYCSSAKIVPETVFVDVPLTVDAVGSGV